MRRDSYRTKRTLIGQLPMGADLYDSISRICTEEDIKIGTITAIGAVSQAAVAYYNQSEKKYTPLKFEKHLEILNCTGNVSLKDGKPFVHMHATFTDTEGNSIGGHLTSGTVVFVCELAIEELEGKALDRQFDEKTGLNLWGRESRLVP
jgi:predicted DNA-binding protein with PD1-like motif